jgi:hypothetical protein
MAIDHVLARSHPEQTRKSVTLTRRDLVNLDIIRSSSEALAFLGAPRSIAEAALLRLLLTDAIERALESAQDAGYAALAESFQNSPDEAAIRAATRRRRRVRTDVDE